MKRWRQQLILILSAFFLFYPLCADSGDQDNSGKPSPTQRLVDWAKKPWVDVNNLSNGNSGDRSGGTNQNSSNPNRKSRGGKSGQKVSIEFDDNAPKGQKPGEHGKEAGGEENGLGSGDVPPLEEYKPKVVARGPDGSEAYDRWYPMCLFIDPSAVGQEAGNSTVKGLVDQAARCFVNLVVVPITVRPGSYPLGDPNGTNQLQQAACNMVGQLDNAERASTSICVNHDRMADKMCDSWESDGRRPTVKVAGCAVLQSSDAEKARIDAENARRVALGLPKIESTDGSKNRHSGNSAAPSIEDRGSCDAGTVGHESLGHSMWGHPNGDGDGHGIKDVFNDGGPDSSGGWLGAGCAAMWRNGFHNYGKWKYHPKTQKYYVEQKDPDLQWNLSSGRKLFGRPPAIPLAAKSRIPPKGGNGNRSSAVGRDPRPQVAGDDPPQEDQAAEAKVQFTSTEDAKHKKVNAKGSAINTLLANVSSKDEVVNIVEEPSMDINSINKPAVSSSGNGGGSKGIVFDDNAPKNASGGSDRTYSGGGSPSSSTRKPGSSFMDGEILVSGDRPMGSASDEFMLSSREKSTSIGYDDSAVKGENAGGMDYSGRSERKKNSGVGVGIGQGWETVVMGQGESEDSLGQDFFKKVSRRKKVPENRNREGRRGERQEPESSSSPRSAKVR